MFSEIKYDKGFLARLGLLSLLGVIGFDLFLHAGILSPLYRDPGTFLLPPEKAFKLMPLGYLAFAILNVMLGWLMIALGTRGAAEGFRLGMTLGLFIWVALGIGLASIAAAPWAVLVGWSAGQAVELGIAGAIIGWGFEKGRLGRIGLSVAAMFLVCAVLAVVLQNIMK